MEYLWSQLAAGGLLAVGQPIGGHTGSPLPPGQLSLSAGQLSSLSAGQLSSLSAGPSSHLAASSANLGGTSTSSAAAAAAHAAYTQRMNLLNTSFTQALAAQGRCSSSADRSIWSPFLFPNRSPTNQGPFPNPQPSLGGSTMKSGVISSSSQGGAENNRERGGIISSSQSNGNLTCPVCLVNLKPNEVNGHFYKEIHEMETYRNALRISDMTNRDHHDHELKRRSLALADGQLTLNNKVQPCSRWQTYQRVRQNRQSRLAGLLRCKRTASVTNGTMTFLSPNCETNGLTSIHSPGSAASGSGFLSSSTDHHPYGSHPIGPGQRSSPSAGNQSESPAKHARSSPGHRGMETSGPRMVNGNFTRNESFRDGAREAAALRDSFLRDGATREPSFLKDGAPREGFLKDGTIIRDGIILRDGATNIDHMGHPRGLPFTFYKPWSMEGPLDKFHRGGHFGSVGGSVGNFGIENLGSFGNGNTGSVGGNSGNTIGNIAGNFIGNVGSEEKDQRSNDSDMSPKRASENSDSSRTSGDVQEIRKNSSPRNLGEMTEIRDRENRRSETEMRMMRPKEGSSPQSASSLPPPSPLSPKRRSRSRSPIASPKSTLRSLSPKSDNDDSNISVDDN